MASKGNGFSRPDPWGGGFENFDKNGKKVSETRRNAWGDGFTTFDNRGRIIGYSREDAFGGYTHYDAKGKKIGYSRDGFLGTTHYDERGREVGRSEEGYFEITHKGDFNPAVGETRDKLLRWKTQGFIGYPGTVQYREDRSDPAEVKALVELIEEIDEEMLQLEDECWGMEPDLDVIAEYEKEEEAQNLNHDGNKEECKQQ